jgi:prephenate dehydrogenase
LGEFGTVTIVGVGLIGGSIGLALRARALASRVVGLGRDRERLARAQARGAVDDFSTDYEVALAGSSIVVVCTPVDCIAEDVARAARIVGPETLITDAGSTKQGIIERVVEDPESRVRYVGAHPIAGSERSGVDAARVDLFDGSVCVLTPVRSTEHRRTELAHAFWESLGCQVVSMTPMAHDEALAQMSHLPHVVAATLARSAPVASLAFGGGAFRDMTRVAAADPALWVSILLENRNAVLQSLDRFRLSLDEFRDLLHQADSERLAKWWRVANEQRGRFEQKIKPGRDLPPGSSFASNG